MLSALRCDPITKRMTFTIALELHQAEQFLSDKGQRFCEYLRKMRNQLELHKSKASSERRREAKATMSAIVDLVFAARAASNISDCAALWRFDAFSSR